MRLIDGHVIAFIWDFDGVIVHTPHEKAWAIASQVYGAGGFNHEFYRRYVSGRPRLEGDRLILELLGVYEKRNITTEADKERLLKELTNYKNRIYLSLIKRGEFKVNWDAVKFIIKAKRQGSSTYVCGLTTSYVMRHTLTPLLLSFLSWFLSLPIMWL